MTRARIQPVPRHFPSASAVAYGEDRFGLWEALLLNGVRQVMRWIPSGRFKMGAPEVDRQLREDEVQHLVVLTRGFWIADTACTIELWKKVMGLNAMSYDFHYRDGLQKPVGLVSWDDVVNCFLPRARAYCPGLRLPTEAEWEYACRADASGYQPFSFGGHIHSGQVNFRSISPLLSRRNYQPVGTVPVKSLPCNDWGLYQMHGNVWEWCEDWHKAYLPGDLIDPVVLDAFGSSGRVARGGSWYQSSALCRSASRIGRAPSYRAADFSFRLARGD